MSGDNRVECTKCKFKVECTEIVVWNNKIECYECWEFLISKKRVKELREQLSQYIEIDKDKNEPKEGLTLSQLEEVKQIFKDNYFGESEDRSKVIFNALVWKGRNNHVGHPLECLKKIDAKIKELTEPPAPRPKLPEIYTLNCPFCNKKFSCELERGIDALSGKWREAKDELNEKRVKHIREVHGEGGGERESDSNDNNSEDNQKIELQTDSLPKSNLPNSTENKPPWPLIITGVLLAGVLLIGGIFLVKHKSKSQKVK